MGDVYTLLCLLSAKLGKMFGLRNLYYSKISEVMHLGAKTQVRMKYTLRPNAAYLNS